MNSKQFEPSTHQHERKYFTTLFPSAKEAFSNAPRHTRYLVIESQEPLPQSLFRESHICPVYVHKGKTYIELEGDCLWIYFCSRQKTDFVVTEEELWALLQQMTSSLITLKQHGQTHYHLKEYSVRRVDEHTFKLIYHPLMSSVKQVLDNRAYHWYNFYLPPQSLDSLQVSQPDSVVFSLGAMVLNLMNPLDCKRDIYSSQAYQINPQIIEQKINNTQRVYSQTLIQIVRSMLEPSARERPSLQQLKQTVDKNSPFMRKSRMRQQLQSYVSSQLSKSREKRLEAERQDLSSSSNINFDRGTFGGQSRNQANVQSQEEEPVQQSASPGPILLQTSQVQPEPQAREKISPPVRQQSNVVAHHPELEESSLSLSSFSIISPERSEEMIEKSIQQFKQKEYHLKLTQCLQSIPQLVHGLKSNGIRMADTVYYGTLVQGRRNGLGLVVFSNGEYYYGHFKQDLFHGQGFYFWNNKQYFLGLFDTGKKTQGQWYGKHKYIGQVKKNKRHGIGWCLYASGKSYEGEWFQGKYNGSGVMTEPSGQRFIGLFKKGVKWGRGYYLAEHCRITGVWDGEHANGPVQIAYNDGNHYKGMINNEFEKHGEGTFSFAAGSVCEGVFEADQFVHGEVVYKNGERYIGYFREFRRHGRGIYYYNSREVRKGQWKDGLFLRQED